MSLCKCGELSLDQTSILLLLSNGDFFNGIYYDDKTGRFISLGFHSPACPSLQQHQIKSRCCHGTMKCSTSSAFSSLLPYCEVVSSVFLSVLFLKNCFHCFIDFTRKYCCASGADKGKSNFIIVKCPPPHSPL